MLSVKILLLLFSANGAPIILHKLLDGRWNCPLDGGLVLPDGQPLLGPSKTWRGVVGALLVGAFAGWALGLGMDLGLGVAGFSMLGDLLSSFLKRRLGIPPSGMATGLDQVPEALLPSLWLTSLGILGYDEMLSLVAAFWVLGLALSKPLYWLHIRKQPY